MNVGSAYGPFRLPDSLVPVIPVRFTPLSDSKVRSGESQLLREIADLGVFSLTVAPAPFEATKCSARAHRSGRPAVQAVGMATAKLVSPDEVLHLVAS